MKSEMSSCTVSAATVTLSSHYWPAQAAKLLEEGSHSQVIALCKEHLSSHTTATAGRLLYAMALFRTGQVESAEAQFQRVLADDPGNLCALKHLGDIRMKRGDELTAVSYYERVLAIDPFCRGLKNQCSHEDRLTTRTIAIRRGTEETVENDPANLRTIQFYTETMGELYLSQGHPRLARQVFHKLLRENPSPRLEEKLAEAESGIKRRITD